MPEGDTIHRTQATLSPALTGATLRRFEAPRLSGTAPRVGERIDSVEAVGKHLLIRFSGGLTLETHMRMTGSWHLYRTGERWRKAPHLRRCVVEVEDWVAVCFSAPVVRTYPTAAEGTPLDPLGHLGPDLCDAASADDVVVDDCVERMSRLADPSSAIGDVLLDQRIANGVGNVFRSEVCWHCGVHPLRRLSAVPDGQRRAAGRTVRRAAAGEPRPVGPDDGPRWARRVRTEFATLPAVRHRHPVGSVRRAEPDHLLVPHLSALTGGATQVSTGRRGCVGTDLRAGRVGLGVGGDQ